MQFFINEHRADSTAFSPSGEADFSLVIPGSEMEPTIPAGSTVYIHRCSTAAPGDIVLIMHDGNILCRRMVDDPFGNIYFICDNPDYAPNSIMIRRDAVGSTVCFGTVCQITIPDKNNTAAPGCGIEEQTI